MRRFARRLAAYLVVLSCLAIVGHVGHRHDILTPSSCAVCHTPAVAGDQPVVPSAGPRLIESAPVPAFRFVAVERLPSSESPRGPPAA